MTELKWLRLEIGTDDEGDEDPKYIVNGRRVDGFTFHTALKLLEESVFALVLADQLAVTADQIQRELGDP